MSVAMPEPDPGFLLVDKDGGWTSHDVVAKVRRLVSVKKAGHAGTLDPMATGLVVVGLGRATRLLRFVQDLEKEYLATVVFGVSTDTLDADGAILEREPMPVSEAEVSSILPRFTGEVMQVPPMVSALRMGGRRLYELAREGRVVDRPARAVRIHELELVDFAPSDYPELTLRVVCGRGTYIRSLADDMAQALGGRAHVSSLRRTRIGSLEVEAEGHRISQLERAGQTGRLADLIISPADGLTDLPSVQVGEATADAVRHGVRFPVAVLNAGLEDGPFRVVDESGSLLAVYDRSGSMAAAAVVLS
jgi:tRNA pseudouridine55 synthase